MLGSHESDGTLLIGTVNSNIKNHISGVTTDDATEFPLTVTYTTTGNKYEVYEDGKVDVKGPSITEYVKVGDYVDYDPTYLDAQKTKKVDASKLTYTSPTGTATEHGNGYMSSETGGGQKFTAKSGIMWRILTVTDSKIEIIPSTVIKKDSTNNESGNFVLSGARGYLYAEQELNEICKIFGYGYGADISVGSSFKVGGPAQGEEITRTITDSGARSITVEDINKIAKVGEIKDGKTVTTTFSELDSNYGNLSNPTANVKYPTINTLLGDSITGISNSTGVKNLKYTFYNYNKSRIMDTNLQNMLFTENYWLASRCIKTSDKNASYNVFFIGKNSQGEIVGGAYVCSAGEWSSFKWPTNKDCSIRPVVTLKSNVIDITNITEDSGRDGHAWKLK